MSSALHAWISRGRKQDLRDSNLIHLGRRVTAGEVTAHCPSQNAAGGGVIIGCWESLSTFNLPDECYLCSLHLSERHTPTEPSAVTAPPPTDSSVICAKTLKSNLSLSGHLQEPTNSPRIRVSFRIRALTSASLLCPPSRKIRRCNSIIHTRTRAVALMN